MPKKSISKKSNKAARATTTTITTTDNDNGSNIDSAFRLHWVMAIQLMRFTKKISEVNTFLHRSKKTITSEDIEAEASKAVEQALSPQRYPVLDLYEKYDKMQSAYFETNRRIIKSVVDYLCNQAESKLITPGNIRRKVLHYISSQKLKGKKTEDQTAEANQVECFSQSCVQGLADFLHADYMSDLETDCEVADNSSSTNRVFGQFCSSWRSEMIQFF
ncbi:hypothetical protein PHYBLDRAFT_141113 [Phycomyces blakesleeanus NRRL 1555(-)]|uniref:Uncharacterized protein n=1 Tax=Phycomyces blakesleeanus (strain ATCC 8743b / DSM 1359 / FGSC 10004 / NBRC 33097 / NRRL 1555) TaxID=763407 RepID=A0A167Q4F9_PHYB8|nr:hypothetical protein PHYBLDRAFT_141113 [Phycomyces blakesleeanus NRRL 1555(-)]OAD79058.1 hypothetical protein PHYBLDRAFT_141113 [Phycomyces blakesleeanus NRRL 1555(-)]|eukprot:XP_018297098.1 hypothetical protein PHYBLDRAFT_141113 [Phycomyces blakesleeanus NRRL 1555(-)]